MAAVSWLKGYVLYAVVFLVALLMLINMLLIYRNNQVITFNKQQQEEAERIKVNASEVIRALHLLDMAVRSYAIVEKASFLDARDTAIADMNNAFNGLEKALAAQHYNLNELYVLKDSVHKYVDVTGVMMKYLQRGQLNKFSELLNIDPGFPVWKQCKAFNDRIDGFEDNISRQAQGRYERALKNIYLLQLLLFLFTVPLLAYTAYQANRSIMVAEQLRKSEMTRATMLLEQNALLERTVHQRTVEILTQNEEISAQNEEIVSHNEQLQLQQQEIERQRNVLAEQHNKVQLANRTIEEKNELIQRHNRELVLEVTRQTQDLKQANLELIEHNSRLEQFAFIISHNLRAPMARLVGLSEVLNFAKDDQEVAEVVKLMVRSTYDLDQVIKDLTVILGVQKMNTQILADVNLRVLFEKVMQSLEEEIKQTHATVTTDFSLAQTVHSLPPYLESIFYNLLSNAIKYRDPKRAPVIDVRSREDDDYVVIAVRDNGLGIDLGKYQDKLFNLYKRFHHHVEGKGMGLYLVKTQVAAVSGKIEVESVVGEGTTFRVFLRRDHPSKNTTW
ncbi:sensor histidine kinase [Chryseolinea lacunae]|uniref:histidine kinase n=1 Tax=Chryseolinea lacunae TaxID=2801331 RepID=A0ABS1KSW7_9BACT|nr:ATP-binding protein [Chryseolinea lacunae]MBL0742317.1 hypothetical protein [Chryseolinea lacunae]